MSGSRYVYTTSKVAEPQTYKTPLVGDIRVFTGQRKVVFQDRYRLREAYAMERVRSLLPLANPIRTAPWQCIDICPPRQSADAAELSSATAAASAGGLGTASGFRGSFLGKHCQHDDQHNPQCSRQSDT